VTVHLEIHEHRIGLKINGAPEIADQWRAYVGAKSIDYAEFDTCDIRLAAELAPTWTNDRQEEGIRFTSASEGIGQVHVDRPLVSGVLENGANGLSGTFKLNGDGPQALDGLAAFALSLLCAMKGDLLLHSSAVVRGDGACLFLGPSGSGKTTVALDLGGGAAAMSVDTTLITTGSEHRIVAHGTPFSDTKQAITGPRHLPVRGLFFLEQADHHEVTRLSAWEATRNLVRNAIIHGDTKESTARSMRMVGEIVDLGRSYRLGFRRDAGFWPLVDDALRESAGKQ